MSGVGSTGSSTTSGTLGDAPPVSFPGISSGIDYNAIIQKYTAQTLAQEKPTQAQINNLGSANTAVLKIQNLIGGVQDTLSALSDPSVFGAYKATVGNTASGSPAATATQIAGTTAIPGTYSILSQTAATTAEVINSSAANAKVQNAAIVAATNLGSPKVALSTQGTSVTPTNGLAVNGKLTINGTTVNYDVAVDTLQDILDRINSTVAGVNATYNAATDAVTVTGVTSIGSGGDSGNLASVLKLDTAQIVAGTVTSSSTIGGINADALLNATGKNGFANNVTGGTFTINGVQFTVDPTKETLNQVISQINSSSAGVIAYYNTSTSQLLLTNTTPGPQSIVVGAAADTSNFLQATGLAYAVGANPSLVPAGTITQSAGQQASVQYQDASGTHTVYSNSNDFKNVIPGIDLSVTQSSPVGFVGTYYTVTVGADPSAAEKAINKFITAYNAVINELNTDTRPPSVVTGTTSSGKKTSGSTAGGVLYNNFQVSTLRDQLVQLVSGFIPSGSTAYNSLASIGIKLDTSSQSVGTTDANDASDSNDSSNQNSSNFDVKATSGRLAALDTTAFEAAYSANTSAVASLFTNVPAAGLTQSQISSSGVSYGFTYQFGSLLANSNGLATFLKNSVVTPSGYQSSLLNAIVDSNDLEIKSLQKQIDTVNKEANQQANQLRAQFSASESQIAQLQGLQQQVAAIGH